MGQAKDVIDAQMIGVGYVVFPLANEGALTQVTARDLSYFLA